MVDDGSVAVVIPCKNAENWLPIAIESVLGQCEGRCDIIVVDDASTDNSRSVVARFEPWVRSIPSQGVGAAAARNSGARETNAAWILFLDADDYLLPNSIGVWRDVGLDSGADLVIGPFVHELNGVRSEIIRQPPDLTGPILLERWVSGKFTGCCSILWRRRFLERISGWNELAVRNDDGELIMRAVLNGARPISSDSGCGVYFQHDSNGRVSRRVGREVLECEFGLLADLVDLADATGQAFARPALARAFYRLAYEAYACGVDEIGQRSLRQARAMGLKGHVGSTVHQGLSYLLGLRLKMRLTGRMRGRVPLVERL